MNDRNIHEYIERLSNLLRNESRKAGAAYGLLPIQIEALHYLSICNRYSNTPMGVTEYLGQTKGTVSQSLKVLEKKGFLTKQTDCEDKRISHLHVTQAGRDLLASIIPASLFSHACKQLSTSSQTQIGDNLQQLLHAIQQSHQMKTFGVCHTCRYHQTDEQGEGFFCGLTLEALSVDDSQLICREHED